MYENNAKVLRKINNKIIIIKVFFFPRPSAISVPDGPCKVAADLSIVRARSERGRRRISRARRTGQFIYTSDVVIGIRKKAKFSLSVLPFIPSEIFYIYINIVHTKYYIYIYIYSMYHVLTKEHLGAVKRTLRNGASHEPSRTNCVGKTHIHVYIRTNWVGKNGSETFLNTKKMCTARFAMHADPPFFFHRKT